MTERFTGTDEHGRDNRTPVTEPRFHTGEHEAARGDLVAPASVHRAILFDRIDEIATRWIDTDAPSFMDALRECMAMVDDPGVVTVPDAEVGLSATLSVDEYGTRRGASRPGVYDPPRSTMSVGELRATLADQSPDTLVCIYVDDWYHHVDGLNVPSEGEYSTVVLTPGADYDTREQ